MADFIQPFVVLAGLATGITATTVITETASLPLAVTTFNGITGDVGFTAGTGIALTQSGKNLTITNTQAAGSVDKAFVIAMSIAL